MAPYLDADGSNTRLKRLMLAAASALVTVNIWTGAPLIALWASSVIVDEKQLSMKALLIVVVVMGAILLLLAYALVQLNDAYEELAGSPRRERRSTWLRSASTQNQTDHGPATTTVVERIVIASVYITVTALMIWLVFFAGTMLPNSFRNG